MSENLALILPKKPLDRFDFLSVPADEFPAGVDFAGVELDPTPVVTVGAVVPAVPAVPAVPTGFDIGETSRESSCASATFLVGVTGAAVAAAGVAALVVPGVVVAGAEVAGLVAAGVVVAELVAVGVVVVGAVGDGAVADRAALSVGAGVPLSWTGAVFCSSSLSTCFFSSTAVLLAAASGD